MKNVNFLLLFIQKLLKETKEKQYTETEINIVFVFTGYLHNGVMAYSKAIQ